MMLNTEQLSQLTLANTVLSVIILGVLMTDRCGSNPDEGRLQPDLVNLTTATREPTSSKEPVAEAPPRQNAVETQTEPQNTAQTASESETAGGTSQGAEATNEVVGAVGFAALLEATVEPLKVAASDHQEDSAQYLPSAEELEAAVASNSLESPETVKVLKKLEAGYAQYNMPFPSLKLPTQPNVPTERLAPEPQNITPPDPTLPPGIESGKDSPAVRSYLLPTIERLQTEINAKGMSGEGYIPSEAELSAAINSGSFASDETVAVLTKLRKGFEDCAIDFPEPGSIEEGTTAPPPTEPTEPSEGGASEGGSGQSDSTGQNEAGVDFAQQEIIVRAYFEGQIQRVKMLAEQAGTDISSMIPSASDIQAAAKTGKIESAESLAAIEKLASAYAALNQPFNPPIASP